MTQIPRQCRVGDEFHRTHGNIQVMLDGVPVQRVIAFDMDTGTVERYQMKDGQYVTDAAGENLVPETLCGVVTAELVDENL